jgi:hypothetical protein
MLYRARAQFAHFSARHFSAVQPALAEKWRAEK